MVAAGDAAHRLHKHFAELNAEEFRRNVERYSPEVLEEPEELQTAGGTGPHQLVLFQPRPSPLPLEAYLACALSGLSPEQRQLVFQISDVVSMICSSTNITLYEPRKKTDPVSNPEISDTEVWGIDREKVVSSDLLIHLCHYPSTGSGEELDFAYNALVPIILVSHGDNRVSRMVTGIPALRVQITYTEPEDLRSDLRHALMEIRPILEVRKMAFSLYDANLVGSKVRSLRESVGLSRAEVAAKTPLVTEEFLRHLEESVDRVANPSLIQLRQLATILKTTVADLVEPDLDERLMVTLQDWVGERVGGQSGRAARFPGMSLRDRNKLIRRILLRVMDSLEEEDEDQ